MSAKVAGYCPMGCGDTLFLGSGGYVTCSWIDCPRPDAASDILGEREAEHVVKLDPRDFTVKHPLRERLDGELMSCSLHHWLVSRSGPPTEPGVYRVTFRGSPDKATWQRIEARP